MKYAGKEIVYELTGQSEVTMTFMPDGTTYKISLHEFLSAAKFLDPEDWSPVFDDPVQKEINAQHKDEW